VFSLKVNVTTTHEPLHARNYETSVNVELLLFYAVVKANALLCRLGGVVGSVLANGPKGRRFKPGRGDGFVRVIKISSTPSSGMGSKSGGPMSCKILRHVKGPSAHPRC
jgi:hypothetical protein